MDISVVIPLYNEAESLPELFSWIERVMKEHNYTYEVIFVNDGSTDNTLTICNQMASRGVETTFSTYPGNQVPSQLRQVAGIALRIPAG